MRSTNQPVALPSPDGLADLAHLVEQRQRELGAIGLELLPPSLFDLLRVLGGQAILPGELRQPVPVRRLGVLLGLEVLEDGLELDPGIGQLALELPLCVRELSQDPLPMARLLDDPAHVDEADALIRLLRGALRAPPRGRAASCEEGDEDEQRLHQVGKMWGIGGVYKRVSGGDPLA